MSKTKNIKAKPRSRINSLRGREVLDSKASPTIEVELETEKGLFKAAVPSGTSEGKYEALELRDGGKRYQGKGVLKAIKNIEEIIAPKIKGKDPKEQEKIDQLMIGLDGTDNKSNLGSNAILAVSLAVCRAGAGAKNIPLWEHISALIKQKKPVLPKPSILVIEGGLHGGSGLDFQEFMVVPEGSSFKKQLEKAVGIYLEVKNILEKRYGPAAINVGFEGGFVVPFSRPEEALAVIMESINEKEKRNKTKIALDVAASSFYTKKVYKFGKMAFTKKGLLAFYSDLIKKFPIFSLEDPFAEDDWKGFQNIMKEMGKKITIVGDDLLATNINRIKEAERKKACNGLLLKPDQVGTVTEALRAAELAKSYGWKIMVSHRSGDTPDSFISDFAVGIGADFIKSGAPARGERIAKYNRLLEIEEELKKIGERPK